MVSCIESIVSSQQPKKALCPFYISQLSGPVFNTPETGGLDRALWRCQKFISLQYEVGSFKLDLFGQVSMKANV